jgi:hypothetical protein
MIAPYSVEATANPVGTRSLLIGAYELTHYQLFVLSETIKSIPETVDRKIISTTVECPQ